MLTPAFEITQDEQFVTIFIKTPFVKFSDVDFFVNGCEFKFYIKPYFLRLCLPGEVEENGRESASFDVERGVFMVKLPKVNPGEEFPNLDMLTTLLSPKKQVKSVKKPLIEVIAETNEISDNSSSEGDDFDWEIEQENGLVLDVSEKGKYGFANQRCDVFTNRQEELHEIADVPDAEHMTAIQRRVARLAAEDQKFDEEYYLADFFEEGSFRHLIDYRPEWEENYDILKTFIKDKEQMSKDEVTTSQLTEVSFTDEEKQKLRRLSNKEYLLDDEVQLSVFLGLVDIMFAFAYNRRSTEGENTVESAWTISKISSTLSWFETFSNVNDVIIACCRRCLCYPLIRHWGLIMTVLEDTKKLFMLGRRQLLKCLLEIHSLFSEDEPRYILNELFITDYCVWLQKASEKKLMSLTQKLNKVQIYKSQTGWMLEELETAAETVLKEKERITSDNEVSNEYNSDDDSDDSGDDDDDDDESSGDDESNDDADNSDSDDDDDEDDGRDDDVGNVNDSDSDNEGVNEDDDGDGDSDSNDGDIDDDGNFVYSKNDSDREDANDNCGKDICETRSDKTMSAKSNEKFKDIKKENRNLEEKENVLENMLDFENKFRLLHVTADRERNEQDKFVPPVTDDKSNAN